jgi:hypothetical protein
MVFKSDGGAGRFSSYRRLPSLPYRGFPNPQAVRQPVAHAPRTGPPIGKLAILPDQAESCIFSSSRGKSLQKEPARAAGPLRFFTGGLPWIGSEDSSAATVRQQLPAQAGEVFFTLNRLARCSSCASIRSGLERIALSTTVV